MNTAVVPAKSFEEKMKDRIKDSIGDLISDEDLAKLVNKALDDEFFKPRKNPKKTYNSYNEPDTIPGLLYEIVAELLRPVVAEVVSKYIKEHNTEVLNTINTVVERGVGLAMIGAMNSQFQNQLHTFQSNIQNQLNSR